MTGRQQVAEQHVADSSGNYVECLEAGKYGYAEGNQRDNGQQRCIGQRGGALDALVMHEAPAYPVQKTQQMHGMTFERRQTGDIRHIHFQQVCHLMF